MYGIALIESPVGPLTVVARGDVLVMVRFGAEAEAAWNGLRKRGASGPIAPRADPAGAVSALRAYFRGQLSALDAVPVDPQGTAFQRKVWSAIREVPAGSTSCYADIARRVGAPTATRAVGAANGANPIPLILPCHRIIGSGGSLVGYGGGLARKRWLLQHEGVLLGL